jgi:hypothetical protein
LIESNAFLKKKAKSKKNNNQENPGEFRSFHSSTIYRKNSRKVGKSQKWGKFDRVEKRNAKKTNLEVKVDVQLVWLRLSHSLGATSQVGRGHKFDVLCQLWAVNVSLAVAHKKAVLKHTRIS